MGKYIFKRVLGFFIVFIGVTILAFLLSSISNQDPAFTIAKGLTTNPTPEMVEKIRQEFDLDKPLVIRYFIWLSDALKGDFGIAYTNKVPVLENFANCLPNTLLLAGLSLCVIIIFSLLFGLLCVTFRDSAFDHIMRLLTIIGVCLPVFWLGYLLLVMFSLVVPIFSISSTVGLGAYILPTIALSLPIASVCIRQFRSSLIAEYNKDYATYLRSRGLSRFFVLRKYVMRNALPPLVTLIASQSAFLLAGSAVVESVFSINGLGLYLIQAIIARDVPTISASTLIIASIFVVFNLLTDMMNIALRPKDIRGYENA